ncbi:MAG: hypothetical protein ACTSWX_14775 [Promethearchaeota archaeon]
MKDLTDILNVRDERKYAETGPEINQENFDKWFGYKEGTNQTGNYETYVEFADQGENSTGISMMAMKFRPEQLAEVVEPTVYSGFLSVYDVREKVDGSGFNEEKIKTRKIITVIIYPGMWEQKSQRTVLNGSDYGEGINSISTDVSDYDIQIDNSNENYTQ